MSQFPISPLSLDGMTRDYWGSYDAAIIAQLAPLCENDCYQPKLYRAPSVPAELMQGGTQSGYASYGLKITPGSIIYGFYLPPSGPLTPLPGQFNVQVRDQSLKMDWFDQPIPSYFLANAKLSYLSVAQNVVGAFPNLLGAPVPVVGNGLFLVQIWETSGVQQRIELVFGVLEAIGEACL